MINEIMKIGQFMIEAYIHAWPYLLVTIPLAVLVNVSGISKYIERAFSARPMISIILATVVGAFSPFCSCGVIPIISALLIGGVPLAPVMSFWLASPSMDPEVFFLSVSQLGMDLAVWRLAGTFIMSLAGGYITHFLIKINWLERDVLKARVISGAIPAVATAQSCNCSEEKPDSLNFEPLLSVEETDSCTTGSCGTSCGSANEKGNKKTLISRILKESKLAVFMIVKFMTLAFFLEALIIFYLPEEWIISLLGSNNDYAILTSAFIGIPLYTTNLTALGLMGGLLELGMNPGAVLAFLIGGATTTIPAMAAVYGLVKKRVFILYVSFALGAALLTGYLYQLFSIFKY